MRRSCSRKSRMLSCALAKSIPSCTFSCCTLDTNPEAETSRERRERIRIISSSSFFCCSCKSAAGGGAKVEGATRRRGKGEQAIPQSSAPLPQPPGPHLLLCVTCVTCVTSLTSSSETEGCAAAASFTRRVGAAGSCRRASNWSGTHAAYLGGNVRNVFNVCNVCNVCNACNACNVCNVCNGNHILLPSVPYLVTGVSVPVPAPRISRHTDRYAPSPAASRTVTPVTGFGQ